ncbi:MAG: hypothetical protein U0457_07815 [Candidatus Sericytochromatia bacterium]
MATEITFKASAKLCTVSPKLFFIMSSCKIPFILFCASLFVKISLGIP